MIYLFLGIMKCPFGFFSSEAILANIHVGAIPIETVNFVESKIFSLISLMIISKIIFSFSNSF